MTFAIPWMFIRTYSFNFVNRYCYNVFRTVAEFWDLDAISQNRFFQLIRSVYDDMLAYFVQHVRPDTLVDALRENPFGTAWWSRYSSTEDRLYALNDHEHQEFWSFRTFVFGDSRWIDTSDHPYGYDHMSLFCVAHDVPGVSHCAGCTCHMCPRVVDRIIPAMVDSR